MGFFEDVVGKLFGKQTKSQPLIHEVLERSESELWAYQRWAKSVSKTDAVRDFDRAYVLKKQKIESLLEVHLLESQYSNGFAITFQPNMEEVEFRHLFDYFKEKVLTLGYKLAQADRKIIDKSSYEETVEKWYLKPLAEDLQATVVNQKYGNILIEMVLIDRKPSYLKLMANIYQDRLYSKALPFQELYEQLVEN